MNSSYITFKNNYINSYKERQNSFIDNLVNNKKNNSKEYKELIKKYSDPFSNEFIKEEEKIIAKIKKEVIKNIKFKNLTESSIRYAFAIDFYKDNKFYQSFDFNNENIKNILDKFNKTILALENSNSKLLTVITNDKYLGDNNPLNVLHTNCIRNADTILMTSYINLLDNLYRNDFNKKDNLNEEDKKLLDTDYLVIKDFPCKELAEKDEFKYIDSMTRLYSLIKIRNIKNKITILEVKGNKKIKFENIIGNVCNICYDFSNENLASLINSSKILSF